MLEESIRWVVNFTSAERPATAGAVRALWIGSARGAGAGKGPASPADAMATMEAPIATTTTLIATSRRAGAVRRKRISRLLMGMTLKERLERTLKDGPISFCARKRPP